MISIVVPILNEEKNLPDFLSHLQIFRKQGNELIIVDGGSRDNSLMLAQEYADQVIVSQVGRAIQMNSGAEISTGDVLVFLHSDTTLPDNALHLVADEYCPPFWGRFDVSLSGRQFVFRIIETFINLRSRLTGINTGDQALFIDRELFNSIGGFPEIALMEDVAISKKLKTKVKPVCLTERVITSSRRWEKRGVFPTIFLMWKLRLYYFFGVSPNKLQRLYR